MRPAFTGPGRGAGELRRNRAVRSGRHPGSPVTSPASSPNSRGGSGRPPHRRRFRVVEDPGRPRRPEAAPWHPVEPPPATPAQMHLQRQKQSPARTGPGTVRSPMAGNPIAAGDAVTAPSGGCRGLRDLPGARGRGRDLPGVRGERRDLPAARGRGRDLPAALAGSGRDLPGASGSSRGLPGAGGGGRRLAVAAGDWRRPAGSRGGGRGCAGGQLGALRDTAPPCATAPVRPNVLPGGCT